MIDLTVVIPSYETRELLAACLASVEAARLAHPEISVETIVVDNGSRDGSAKDVEKNFPHFRLIACVRNRGFAAAANLGLRLRRGRMAVLLNSDVTIDPDLLFLGLKTLDDFPEAGVVGASLTHSDGRAQRSVHPLPDLQTELLPDFVLRVLRPGSHGSARFMSRHETADPGPRQVEAVRGAVFFIRGKLLDEVGPLSEAFFFFLEETEFCARVHRAGFQVVYAEGLKATHRLGASSKLRAPMVTRIEFHRSLYRYLERQQGRTTARAVRSIRTLRGAVLVLGMTLAYAFSARLRRRFPERWGLLLWHLRGCPEEPRLVDALESGRPEPTRQTAVRVGDDRLVGEQRASE